MSNDQVTLEHSILTAIMCHAREAQHEAVVSLVREHCAVERLRDAFSNAACRTLAQLIDDLLAEGRPPTDDAILVDFPGVAVDASRSQAETHEAAREIAMQAGTKGLTDLRNLTAWTKQLGAMCQREKLRATLKECERTLETAPLDAVAARLHEATAPTSHAGTLMIRSHADRERERMTPEPSIIDGLLPVGGIGALIAMPGVGKTLVAAHLARCVVAGTNFGAHACASGQVLYVATDSPASTEARLLALPPDVVGHVHSVIELPNSLPGGTDDLHAAVASINALGGPSVRLVIIDTWDSSRNHTGDGYAGQDALLESLMRGLRTLATDLQLAVVILHHATRGDTGRARGSVVFDARADWIALISKSGDHIQVETKKARDGEDGVTGSFRIVPKRIGTRDVPTLEAAPTDSDKPPASGSHQEQDLAILSVLVRAGGVVSKRQLAEQAQVPVGSVQRIVDRLRAKGWVDRDAYKVTAEGISAYDDNLLGAEIGVDQ